MLLTAALPMHIPLRLETAFILLWYLEIFLQASKYCQCYSDAPKHTLLSLVSVRILGRTLDICTMVPTKQVRDSSDEQFSNIIYPYEGNSLKRLAINRRYHPKP